MGSLIQFSSPGGGGIGGTVNNYEVAAGDGSGALTSSSSFTWNGSSLIYAGTNPAEFRGSGGSTSTVLGSGSAASNTGAVALGYNAQAGGSNGIALGTSAVTGTGAGNISIGQLATGSGSYGIGIGLGTSYASNDIVIGYSAAGGYGGGVAIGYQPSATSNAVAMGMNASAVSSGVAIGPYTDTGGSSAVALGASAQASQSYGVAIGESANDAYGSIAIGRASTTTAYGQFVAGSSSTPYSDVYFGRGIAYGAPVSTTLNATGGSGTDIAGGALLLAGGKSTGAGVGGSVKLQTSAAGTTGTTLNSLSTMLEVTGDQKIGLYGVTPVARSTGWSVSNPSTRKTFDTTTVTLQELAEVVGTLVDYLKTLGPLAA